MRLRPPKPKAANLHPSLPPRGRLPTRATPEVAIFHPSLPHLGGRWRRSRRMRGVSASERRTSRSATQKERTYKNLVGSIKRKHTLIRVFRKKRAKNPPSPSRVKALAIFVTPVVAILSQGCPIEGEGTLHTPRPR